MPEFRHYKFKPDYRPTYSAEEIRRFQLQAEAELEKQSRLDVLRNDLIAVRPDLNAATISSGGQTPRSSTPVREDGPAFPPDHAAPTPYSGHWIFQPALIEGLGDREMIVMILEQVAKDYRVHYQKNFDGQQGLYYRKDRPGGSKSTPALPVSISNLPWDMSCVKSLTLPKPARATGLYIILHPLKYAGFMGRRVGQVYNKEHPSESLWILQLVRMHKIPGRGDKHEQEILSTLQHVTVEGKWILQVYETEDDRKRANNEELQKIRDMYRTR